MKNKSRQGFQVGDIIKPLPGKSQSNYWRLEKLKEAVVIHVDRGYSIIRIQIIEGRCTHREYCTEIMDEKSAYKIYGVRNAIESRHHSVREFDVYDNAFELAITKPKDYEIF